MLINRKYFIKFIQELFCNSINIFIFGFNIFYFKHYNKYFLTLTKNNLYYSKFTVFKNKE